MPIQTPPIAHILLVEDNRMDVELTLNALQESPGQKQVRVVSDGQAALDYLEGKGEFANREQFPLPDLILLDLKLPLLDGHQILARLKSLPVVRRVPVLIFTSSVEEKDRALCYDNGCNSYLEKPHSYEGYIEMMRDIHTYWMKRNVAPLYTL